MKLHYLCRYLSCRRVFRLFLFLATSSLYTARSCAQSYYPGGLASTNLLLWLNANKTSSITQNGANKVSQWADLSGNGYNFSQGTTANKPVYGATASPSGQPALTFTSTSSQYLSLANLPATSFTSGVSTFVMASYGASQTTQGWQRIFDFGNGTSNNNFMTGRYGSTANTYYESWNSNTGDQTYTSTNPIVNNTDNIYEAIQKGGTAGNLTTVAHYLAGAAQTATGAAGSSSTYVPTNIARTSNYIGRSNWSADNYFSGTLSEILIYNTAMDTTQRVILENYLAAAWNQTVSVSKYTLSSGASYGTNLVGIGYTSSTDQFLANPSGSTDGLGFSSGNTGSDFLQNAGYVMAAHNGQNNTVNTNASIPGITSSNPISMWNRSWNVQKSGGTSTGALTLQFRFSDYNGSTPSSTSTYALLYNATDGTFSTGTNKLITVTTTTVSTASAMVSFKLTASNLAAGYYTIIYSTSAITLPITFTDFTAVPQDKQSLLSWQISGAVEFNDFVIERSADGGHFTTLGTVAASNARQYTFTDIQPLQGMNYYRLMYHDADGAAFYSAIRSVEFGSIASNAVAVNVYPNPAADALHISLSNVSGPINIRLLDTRGQAVRQISTTAASTLLSLSGLSKGIYVLSINGTNMQYTQEVVKK